VGEERQPGIRRYYRTVVGNINGKNGKNGKMIIVLSLDNQIKRQGVFFVLQIV